MPYMPLESYLRHISTSSSRFGILIVVSVDPWHINHHHKLSYPSMTKGDLAFPDEIYIGGGGGGGETLSTILW